MLIYHIGANITTEKCSEHPARKLYKITFQTAYYGKIYKKLFRKKINFGCGAEKKACISGGCMI